MALGSAVAHTAVLLVFQLGQPRIFFSMARDGLLPPVFARVHPRFRTPHVTTIVTGLLVGGVAEIANIEEMVDLTNIGTLFAFVLGWLAIPVLRRRDPRRERPFRVPGGPYLVPLLGAAACMMLMAYLPPLSWWRFVGWLTLGLGVHCAWGWLHSKLRDAPKSAAAPLQLAALGFVPAAVGMFLMPHDAGFLGVFARAARGGQAASGCWPPGWRSRWRGSWWRGGDWGRRSEAGSVELVRSRPSGRTPHRLCLRRCAPRGP